MSGRRKVITKFMPISFSGVYLTLEVFQDKEHKEMLAISYLVLQAGISYFRCFRQKWRISALALFA